MFCQLWNARFGYYEIMGFGENLHQELEYQGIQIKELAEKTGISKNTLDKYLSGNKSQPSVENAVKIAQAIGVSVEYLVLSGADKNQKLSADDAHLISSYKKLSAPNKTVVSDLIHVMLKRQPQ